MTKKFVKKTGPGMGVDKLKESSFSTIKISNHSKRVYLRTRKFTAAMMAVLFLIPWVILAVYFISGKLGGSGQYGKSAVAAQLTSGPWGTLEVYEMITSPPHGYVKPDLFPPIIEEWLFVGKSREGLESLLDSASLDPAIRARIMSLAENMPGVGWKVRPDHELIMSLSAKSRSVIYYELAKHVENTRKYDPFVYNPAKLEIRLADGNLRPETVTTLRKLLYPRGNRMLLADVVTLLNAVPDVQEKTKLLTVLLRRVSYMLKLRVDADSDLNTLINYWGSPSRREDVEPLLTSLSKLKTGQASPIDLLLPTFAKDRLHSYPKESFNAISKRRDCHWSSLNFFNDTPDDKYTDPEVVRTAILNDYQKIEAKDIRMGDLALLSTPEGKAVHSSIYIAGEFYFSKNGPSHISPWILVKLDEVMDAFPAHENLSVGYYRLKTSTPPAAN